MLHWSTCSDKSIDFFFFQAEDGIRDVAVTGVQTCALPICILAVDECCIPRRQLLEPAHARIDAFYDGSRVQSVTEFGDRSEERRVGKECRSRWSPYH